MKTFKKTINFGTIKVTGKKIILILPPMHACTYTHTYINILPTGIINTFKDDVKSRAKLKAFNLAYYATYYIRISSIQMPKCCTIL